MRLIKNPGRGKGIYDMSCKACHGATGLGDGLLVSADLTTKAFADQSDGAIMHKLQEGRGTDAELQHMDETDLWHVINYIRTFATPKEEVSQEKCHHRD